MKLSEKDRAKNVWCLPTFSPANLPQTLNEGIEHDLILGRIPQWILQLFYICIDTKHDSPIIYCSFLIFIRYYEWVGNKNVNKEANSYIEVN
jgi:hypothetical protein